MDLKFSSACSSLLADDVDCFVCLRVGESQRLSKLGSARVFSLPESAVSVDGKIVGRLDVLKCISSCSIAVDAKGLAPLTSVVLPCPAEPGLGDVAVNVAAVPTVPTSDVQKTVEENNYLMEYGVQEFLSTAVTAVLKERPADPRRFIAEFLAAGQPLAAAPCSSTNSQNNSAGIDKVGDMMHRSQSPPRRAQSPLRTQSPPRMVHARQGSMLITSPSSLSMASELKSLRQHISRQDIVLDEFHDSISQLVRDQPLTFTVLQYNILARYLGNNMEPWLLYGPDISAERRHRVMQKHGERNSDGKYMNVGWPSYVQGILTEEEIKQVEDIHSRVFDWKVRRQRLLDNIASANCDIIALEEMDEYEDFAEALSKDYCGVFRKRPRRSSKDGCAVFWRKSKFELAAFEGFDFVDRADTGGTALKDRTCVLVLLRWATARYGRHESRVLVVCTHLARNPEDPSQTKVRARQAAQLMKHLTDFSMKQNAIEVPVVLMGDLNAQHFGEVRGIARTVFQVSNHPCHNFLFRCADVPTGPTSVTDLRKVRIDAVMFQPQHLKVLGIHVPHLDGKIPDEKHPSDHVAVRVKFEVKADHLKMQECARAWLECVTGTSRLLPMTEREIKRAFAFLDRDSTDEVNKRNLQESILELGMGGALPPERQASLLDCFPDKAISYLEFTTAYEAKFNSSRMGNIGDLEQAFSFFDSDCDGKVTTEDVYTAFSEIVPIDFTQDEVKDMMSQLAADWKDGLDVHTFCEALCKCNFNCSTQPQLADAEEGALVSSKSQKLRENLEQL